MPADDLLTYSSRMPKATLWLLGALLLATVYALSPDPGRSPQSSSFPVLEAQSARADIRIAGEQRANPMGRYMNKRAMRHVRRLAARIGPRVRATRAEKRGAKYIANKLEQYGYQTWMQEFSVDSRRSRNVIARWRDSVRYGIVIGAHMDTVHGSPGANDNASGVAVMLETARLMAGTRQAHWVRFVAFGSEEYGTNGIHHVGSHVYVKRLGPHGRNRQAGMISVDMIADGRPLIVGHAGIGPGRVARTAYRKMNAADIGVRYRVTCDCSDNGPFERAGIPAAFLWSGFEPNYHDPSDTVRHMKPKHMRRTGRAVRVFAKDIDRGMLTYFRQS
jgi:hypothetical protein